MKKIMKKTVKSFCSVFGDYTNFAGSPAFTLASPYIYMKQCHISWNQVFTGFYLDLTVSKLEHGYQPLKCAAENSNGLNLQQDLIQTVGEYLCMLMTNPSLQETRRVGWHYISSMPGLDQF